MYRRVSFTAISASWHGALLREQTSLPKASNRFLVSHMYTVAVAVPNSSNRHHENLTIVTVYITMGIIFSQTVSIMVTKCMYVLQI